MFKNSKNNNDEYFWLKYASLGTQMLVSIGLAVFAGLKLDHWINGVFPIFAWLLPLLVLSAIFYKLIKETSKKK